MIKTEKQRCYLGIIVCLLVFILGYYILNYISEEEKILLGNTIYILIGSVLMAASCIGVLLIIRHLRNLERKHRKRRSRKVVFLKDIEKKSKKK
jgi:accessory gene regulator protein AgrB